MLLITMALIILLYVDLVKDLVTKKDNEATKKIFSQLDHKILNTASDIDVILHFSHLLPKNNELAKTLAITVASYRKVCLHFL